jgi:streptogramin lyase
MIKWMGLGVAAAVCATMAVNTDRQGARPRALRSSDLRIPDVLVDLPDDERKREFILDCTGCHQMDMARVFPDGHRRSDSAWTAIVQRMMSFAGARTGFPVIGSQRDAVATAAYMRQVLPDPNRISTHQVRAEANFDSVQVREYLLDEPTDLPHDIAVDSAGRIVVTGMMTHRMLVLDTASGRWSNIDIPVPSANPRALDVDRAGRWWVALGRPGKVARYTPRETGGAWAVFDAGMYAHSVASAPDGNLWLNGHFTRDPELIARVDTNSSAVVTTSITPHPILANDPGGPIPYELRVARDGTVWTSELRGNRIIGFNPATKQQQVIDMPRPHMGPRRFDVDASGVLWVPAYAANALLRIDPKASGAARIQEFPIPVSNVLPYVARLAPGDSALWIGTGAGGGVFRFDVRTRRFTYIPLPSPGALVRHLTINPRTGDVWLAYGASPGIPARIARVAVQHFGRE